MKCVEESIVDEVWDRVAKMDEDAGIASMTEFTQQQPNLVGFVAAFSEELRDEARELGIYLLFVVYRMFEESTDATIPELAAEDLVARYEAMQELALGLDSKPENFFEELAKLEVANQPWIYQCVVESLIEESDDATIKLSDQELGELFLLLKTAIDSIDSVTND